MIYFIQDESTNHIKIGFTDGDAEGRLKALQTGNPSGMVLLSTMQGDKDRERELHAAFASARERGEWFRPIPSIMQLIIEDRECQAHCDGVSAGVNRPNKTASGGSWPLRIYLAGKIGHTDWRHALVKDLRGAPADDERFRSIVAGGETALWPESINGVHHYAGPFFISCDHGGFHGEDSHGVGSDGKPGCCASQGLTSKACHAFCLRSIAQADLVFAWISDADCYGTIVELGYAKALGKRIWVAGPRRFRDMWFAYELAEYTNFHWKEPKVMLDVWLEALRKEYNA